MARLLAPGFRSTRLGPRLSFRIAHFLKGRGLVMAMALALGRHNAAGVDRMPAALLFTSSGNRYACCLGAQSIQSGSFLEVHGFLLPVAIPRNTFPAVDFVVAIII